MILFHFNNDTDTLVGAKALPIGVNLSCNPCAQLVPSNALSGGRASGKAFPRRAWERENERRLVRVKGLNNDTDTLVGAKALPLPLR